MYKCIIRYNKQSFGGNCLWIIVELIVDVLGQFGHWAEPSLIISAYVIQVVHEYA